MFGIKGVKMMLEELYSWHKKTNHDNMNTIRDLEDRLEQMYDLLESMENRIIESNNYYAQVLHGQKQSLLVVENGKIKPLMVETTKLDIPSDRFKFAEVTKAETGRVKSDIPNGGGAGLKYDPDSKATGGGNGGGVNMFPLQNGANTTDKVQGAGIPTTNTKALSGPVGKLP